MYFNSIHFLIFFPIVVITYFSLPYRFRWAMLLGASYYFYMCWKMEYIFLIITSTLIDYYCGLQMGKTAIRAKRKKFLILSLLTNLGLLFSFKYFNFVNSSLIEFFHHYNIFYSVPAFKVLLPVGISFYTFQTLSYSIDVYRGKTKPEKHLGIFALYVAFFPQLVAGPIERSSHLLPQFYKKNNIDFQRIINGVLLMLWGFFKKIVIADRLAILVDQVYNHSSNFTGVPFVIATIFFAFQIYCDFSGYSDIAIGASQVMGYDIMQNFRQPYHSASVSEFWKRWHISLSTWFKDYFYIPLGGNRVKKWRWYYNLLLVFLISGLWHGANWTFLVWGVLHGFYMVFSIVTKQSRDNLVNAIGLSKLPTVHKILRILTTFTLVCFGWIFFRSASVSNAIFIISRLFTGWYVVMDFEKLKHLVLSLGLNEYQFVIAIASIIIMEIVHLMQRKYGSMRIFLSKQPIFFRWTVYYGLIFGIIVFGQLEGAQQFIYFQF